MQTRSDRAAARSARRKREKRERWTWLGIMSAIALALLLCAVDLMRDPLRPDGGYAAQDLTIATQARALESSRPTEPNPAPSSAPTPIAVAATIAPMEVPTPEPTLRTVVVRAVGDLMVHERQLEIAKKKDGYDFHPQYELIADSLAAADLTIGNLETTIGQYKKTPYSGYPRFNTPIELLDTLRDAGVDFLTLANNHMLDRYFEGLITTADNVDRYGFSHGGSNRTPEERDTPVIVEVNGIRFGMLCYTQHTNGAESGCDSAVFEYGVNYLKNANFKADVAALRKAGADIVIAMPHWGEEYKRKPESGTVKIAKRMIAAGVDVVLGSHPHMVQPVGFLSAETETGEKRTGLVAFSMGNFISNMKKQYTDSGIIVEFTVRERQDGTFAIENVGCVPLFCWRQEEMIQTLSSLKYLDAKPEGMSASRYSRMQASYWELKDLLGDEVVLLAE